MDLLTGLKQMYCCYENSQVVAVITDITLCPWLTGQYSIVHERLFCCSIPVLHGKISNENVTQMLEIQSMVPPAVITNATS